MVNFVVILITKVNALPLEKLVTLAVVGTTLNQNVLEGPEVTDLINLNLIKILGNVTSVVTLRKRGSIVLNVTMTIMMKIL